MYARFLPSSNTGIFTVIWRIRMYYFKIAPVGLSIIIVHREANNHEGT